MTELESTLIGDSAAAPPAHIIEGLDEATARKRFAGAPHTIYEELWHAAFWQKLALDWIEGLESPFPTHNSESFPCTTDSAETWNALCVRFLDGAQHAAAIARAQEQLERRVRCTAMPGLPLREKSVRDLLESTAAHNQYHLGRIVLLRQLLNTWPPPSGGNTW
jgi:uncharacterized damage-inducible protein DinB